VLTRKHVLVDPYYGSLGAIDNRQARNALRNEFGLRIAGIVGEKIDVGTLDANILIIGWPNEDMDSRA
jgi:hypothetical protein